MTTSAASAGPADPVFLEPNTSLLGRMAGIILSPRATFERIALSPRSAGVLAVTWAAAFVSSAALLQTEVGQLALLDQWERTALAFGQPVSAADYAAMEGATRNGALYAAVTTLVSGPLLAAGIAVVLFAVSKLRAFARGITFSQVLAIAAHASVILALRQVIAAPVNYGRETLASPATASLFFSMLDEASPVARFFGMIDVFVVWWLIVLAVGMSVVYRRPARRLALSFAGVYVGVALLLTLVMAVLGGTA